MTTRVLYRVLDMRAAKLLSTWMPYSVARHWIYDTYNDWPDDITLSKSKDKRLKSRGLIA